MRIGQFFQASAFGVFFFEFFQVPVFTMRVQKLLLCVDEVQRVVQGLFSAQLILEYASFLGALHFHVPEIFHSVHAMGHDLAWLTSIPISWVYARTACYVARSLSRMQIGLGFTFTSAAFAFPWFDFGHCLILRITLYIRLGVHKHFGYCSEVAMEMYL